MEVVGGEILEEQGEVTLDDLCRVCDVEQQWVALLVEEGILEPAGGDVAQWRFSGISVRRVRIVTRLQRDLDVNLPGAALAIELLDEIARLRAQRGSSDPGGLL